MKNCSCVYDVNIERISHIFLVFLFLTLGKHLYAGEGVFIMFKDQKLESCMFVHLNFNILIPFFRTALFMQ